MLELDPKGPAHTAACESITYELHLPDDRHQKVLAAFNASRAVLWKAAIDLGELTVREMVVTRDPGTNVLVLTLDGEHWRGGTHLQGRWSISAEGALTELLTFSNGELGMFSEAQRQATFVALLLAASADGGMDPREVVLVRPLLEGGPWGVSTAVVTASMQQAQAQARTVRAPNQVAELGRACQSIPESTREKVVKLLLAIAWADGMMRPEEQWVISAFMQGIGLAGERANTLADAAADSSIFSAIARGRINAVRRLLDGGLPVGTRDARSWTPLHVAVATGQTAIVDLLLERKADVHVKHGQGSPPLFLACNKPYEAIAEKLLRAGAKVDETGVNGLTPLLLAAMFGQTGVVRVLRKAGAALEVVDATGRTPLHVAAAEGRSGAVAFLLAEGALVDARTKRGATALMLAAEAGALPTITALLAAKADVNAVDADQQTALHCACLSNRPEVVALLLAFGAQANAASAQQVTPLHVAAGAGYTSIARLLLDAGATVDAKNVQGGTPLFMAAVRDRREVYDLLAARGANVEAPKGSVGAGLAIKSLRSEPLTKPLEASALRPDDAALAAHGDYQIAIWLNADGTPDQVLVSGKDEKGRAQYVERGTNAEPRTRFFTVTDKDGKRWLPVFTSDATLAAFQRAMPIGWPSDGLGLARAVTVSLNAKVFAIGDLPVDGIVVDPFSNSVVLTAEQCDRVARATAA